MSLSASLASAVSGLTAVSRTAELVSSNVANASTEGYGRREIQLGSLQGNIGGAGVRVIGVERQVNDGAIAQRRIAQAEYAYNEQQSTYFSELEQVYGTPDNPNSLNGKFVAFEASLVAAAGQPSNPTYLDTVAQSASDLVNHLNDVSDHVQNSRQQADQNIGLMVNSLNESLQRVDELNLEISQMTAIKQDASSLMDQRQLEIDKIADIIPIQQAPRDLGRVALMTTNGSVLVDDKAAVFSFTPTNTITPQMLIEDGALGELGLTAAAAQSGTVRDVVAGGALASLFELRDEVSIKSQAQLDAIGRDLIERLADPAVDPTLTLGASGLFTDGNNASFDPLDEAGLAGRIQLNEALNPDDGGDASLIRDGLNATASGPVEDASLLVAIRDALNDSSIPASGDFTQPTTAGNLITAVLSDIGASRQSAEVDTTFSATQVSSLQEVEAQSGVNTDEEMQKLLLIEQAYAANARVIQTVNELFDAILRI